MQQWIETHGTDALRRAYAEGYDVAKGVGDFLLEALADTMDLQLHEEWDSDEERTSPTAKSFGNRDLVQACIKTIQLPDGWHMELSRISRIVLTDGAKRTGVLVSITDDKRKTIRRAALVFE